MLFFRSLHPVTLLALAIMVKGAPQPVRSPPDVIMKSEVKIQELWHLASSGTLYRNLPVSYDHLQSSWNSFLSTKGGNLVETFYSDQKRVHLYSKRKQGRTRFLNLTSQRDAKTYQFKPEDYPIKREMAVLLIEAFAQERANALAAGASSSLQAANVGASTSRRTLDLFVNREAPAARTHSIANLPVINREDWGKGLNLGWNTGASGS
ncbi:uncharacterized protein SPSC_01502 [Sporisorium scitamineum]|uniref:Uncharacterized protein n=1 Tax=Sporisorium scitamineum TaxID=49012 RepID=A0A127ZA79_9BASI|nr:uncharacterized protein SPSC_01502 [Sporisorium scitamineum]